MSEREVNDEKCCRECQANWFSCDEGHHQNQVTYANDYWLTLTIVLILVRLVSFFYRAPRWKATVPWLRIHLFHPGRSKMESFAVGFHRQMSSAQTTGKIDMSPNLPTLISIFGFLALASTQWFTILRHETKKRILFSEQMIYSWWSLHRARDEECGQTKA